MRADANRINIIVSAQWFETQWRVVWIVLKDFKINAGLPLNFQRQLMEKIQNSERARLITFGLDRVVRLFLPQSILPAL